MPEDHLLQLMRVQNAVFTISEIALLWGESDVRMVRKR